MGKKVVTLGEIMLRLSMTTGKVTCLVQSDSLMWYMAVVRPT